MRGLLLLMPLCSCLVLSFFFFFVKIMRLNKMKTLFRAETALKIRSIHNTFSEEPIEISEIYQAAGQQLTSFSGEVSNKLTGA